MLSGMILPFEAIIMPLYYDFDASGPHQHYGALILPQIALNVCFGTFWMRAYFRSVPRSMLEAAEMDGAGSLRTLFHGGPAAGPSGSADAGPADVHVLVERVPAAAGDGDRREPAYGCRSASRSSPASTPPTASVRRRQPSSSSAPIILLFLVFQRSFIQGMATGAVKE